jgi:hypothetical protein
MSRRGLRSTFSRWPRTSTSTARSAAAMIRRSSGTRSWSSSRQDCRANRACRARTFWKANVRIIDGLTDDILKYAPDAMVLVVSNPVDTLTYRVAQRTGWDRSRIFGQAGVLDASRMASFVAQETGFSALDITTIVLGGHGDTMVPVPRFCTINGIPIAHFISEERIAAIMERTRHGGAEILALRGNSSAYDAPGAAVAAMVDAIVNNRRRLLSCVAMLEGEYGETDIAMGVPCVLGERGVESIVELDLNDREREEFNLDPAVERPLECVPRGVRQGATRRRSGSTTTSCNAVGRRAGRAPRAVAAITRRVRRPMTKIVKRVKALHAARSGQLPDLGLKARWHRSAPTSNAYAASPLSYWIEICLNVKSKRPRRLDPWSRGSRRSSFVAVSETTARAWCDAAVETRNQKPDIG